MADAQGITKIVWCDSLGGSPAKVDHTTGIMYLSRQDMRPLSKEIRLFIMLHEMAHVVLRSKDEVEVDNWAFNEYARRGYSLTQGVYALTRVLNDKNPAHAWRMFLQLRRAERYDYEVNHNEKVLKFLQ